MSKPGGSHRLKQNSSRYKKVVKEYQREVDTGNYSSSYFSDVSGGYYLVENSRERHSEDERFVARALADNGFRVIMKDEAGQMVTADGVILSIGEYEQRTPSLSKRQKRGEEKFDKVANMRNALRHARYKRADVAVVYMKNNLHDIRSVKQGIAEFEKTSPYRFKSIIIVTADGRIHKHKHDS